MAYAIAILVFFTLLVLFLLMTAKEAQSGVRMFARTREAWDVGLRESTETFRTINVSLLLSHSARSFIEELAHEVAQVALAAIRATERTLVRAMHGLQASRQSVKTLMAKQHIEEVVQRFKKSETDEVPDTRPVE